MLVSGGKQFVRISIFGLGYVGLVTAVCHAADGHDVVGVDNDAKKLRELRQGVSPISEPAVDDLLRNALARGSLTLTDNVSAAVTSTDAALICVGTPNLEIGNTDLGAVVTVTQEIGAALREARTPYTVLLRSTVPPGATRGVVTRILEQESSRNVGSDLLLYFNPEFLRQGCAVADFRTPPFVVIGTADGTTPPAGAVVNHICPHGSSEKIVLNYQEAELLKIACNAYHALKIDFANEIGTVARHVDADPSRLMNAFVRDTKLNLSAAYLRPGFAFGGSCLPKDVRALNYVAASHGLELPVISAILPSNDAHLQRLASHLGTRDTGTIGLVGLTFKPDTDDLRESAALRLLKQLCELGKDVIVYEPEIAIDRKTDKYVKELAAVLPTHRQLLVDWPTLRQRADTVLITRKGIVSPQDLATIDRPVIDATRLR